MEVFKKTVSAVFGIERRYVIPLFQRPYVWTLDRQWEPLWEDIARRADAEVDRPDIDAPPHFLGALVIQQRPSWGDELLAHDVIDGQQRLTTFQVLLQAFRDVADASGEKQVTAALTSWTRNHTALADFDVEQFKLWPTSRDLDQFKLVMTAQSRAAIERAHPPVIKRKRLQPRPRFVEAYLYFHDRIDGWARDAGDAKVGERLKALRRVFDKRMQFVSIELEKQEDPQAIFETLNARGVPLLASDLLRNYIFQRAGGSEQAEKLHQKYWARFEVADAEATEEGARFWEVEERQGRLSRARLDLFVHHYLAMKRGTEVLSGTLFPTYKEWIRKDAKFASVEDELKEFTAFADRFFALIRPSRTTSVGRFAARLRVLDNSTVYPLVLSLVGDARLPEKERDAILVDLESFLVRRLVCGRPTKNYNRLFLQLLRDFEGAPDRSRATFRALLAAGSGENADWPTDDAFERAWVTVDAYRELKPARVEMILRRVDEMMTSTATESIVINDALTVEHVLPQVWQDHWPVAADADAEAALERREDVVHDFGNLTLLTQPLNSAVSNGPAAKKLPMIALQSALRLNVYFQGRTAWTEDDVEERARAMFPWAKRAWPGP
ncbi:MAG: DUF262 domain-containing protein [Polyangiales bacterium]